MSFHGWLHNLRSALAPGRGQRHVGRRDLRRAPAHRPKLEALEDRSVPAFIAAIDYGVDAGTYGPYSMQVGDFNGDGRPDLATSNDHRSVSVLLSNGDGTFQPARNTSTTYFPYANGYGYDQHALAVGDFDRNGKLDLATTALY